MNDPLNILIVDDDRVDRTIIRRQLAKGVAGAAVHEAATTADALRILGETVIDCLLLDYRLPDQDGLEFYDELKTSIAAPPPAVIILTGQGSETAAVAAMKSGVRDYLVKEQTTPGSLSESIDRAIGAVKAEQDMHAANRQLESMALIDPVTQIGNRHHFEIRLDHALDRARRQSENIGLVMMDLNGFKTINDTHGHHMGDQVLREFAKRLRQCARQSDTIARLGGDEFVLIMESGVTRDGENSLSDRITALVTDPVVIDGDEIHIGVSVGLAQFPDDGNTPEELLRAADEAMYRHKRETRTQPLDRVAFGE